MATLYELAQEYQEFLQMAEDGDIDAEVYQDTLESLDFELEEKAEEYAKVLQQMAYDASMFDAESKRLRNKKITIERNADFLKKRLEQMMIATGKRKFKSGIFSFGIQKNPPGIELDCDISDLPFEYVKYGAPTADKKKILDALKSGDESISKMAHIVQGESIRIR